MSKEIQKILKDLPKSPGIYKMKNKEGSILYIGKAKDLSKRVKQYFKKNYEHSTRTRKLVENIDDIEVITVDTELEAIILETNLIKQFKPKYNILMKDDKNFVYIKITNEDFPRIQIVRKIQKDGAKYIGPKSAAHKVKTTFKVLKKLFPFRHCNLDIELVKENKDPNIDHEVNIRRRTIKYPCLDYFIKRCSAPCIGKVGKEEYLEIIKNVENFLEGRADNILKDLKKEMQCFAQNRAYEKAAKARDKIKKIEDILEKQKVADTSHRNQDIINYCITQDQAYFNLFQVRDGKLLGQENFILKAKDAEEDMNDPEILESFLKQYYELATDIPKEIIIPHKIENKGELEELIKHETNRKPKITIPILGKKNKLLKMSLNNARIYADRNKPKWYEESDLSIKAAKAIQKVLEIKDPLKRIECYDISHLSGTETVGSMIVFQNGAPKNSMYRKFRMKTVVGKPDDYKSMEEVLKRRFSKIALSALHKNHNFKKSRKKDTAAIKKQSKIDPEKVDYNFYILEKDKKISGIIAILPHSKKVDELKHLWVNKKNRGIKLGYKLLKDAIKKAKSKRVYIICHQELKDYYLLAGFEEIKKIPEELEKNFKKCQKETKNPLPLVYDKNKHKPDESFSKIPDLVVIDGGKGQLASATKVFQELNLKIPYVSLAKRLEEIFIPGKEHSLILARNHEGLKLLQRARDEAHRFAISYNKNLRRKKLTS